MLEFFVVVLQYTSVQAEHMARYIISYKCFENISFVVLGCQSNSKPYQTKVVQSTCCNSRTLSIDVHLVKVHVEMPYLKCF